jgi:hypothetical protein
MELQEMFLQKILLQEFWYYQNIHYMKFSCIIENWATIAKQRVYFHYETTFFLALNLMK